MAATFYTQDVLTYNDGDDSLTTTYTLQKFPLYQYREEGGKGYRFVKFDASDVAITANSLLYSKSTSAMDGVVTQDVSDSDRNKVVGRANQAAADATYGWMQTKGLGVINTNGDDDIAIGDAIIASAAGDGTCDSTANGTAPVAKVVGWAVTVDEIGRAHV